jgi:hypothetical protein
MCRKRSDFIIPSSFFPTPPKPSVRPNQSAGQPSRPKNTAKEEIVGDYLAKLKKIPCRYFEEGVKRWREASVGGEPAKLRPVCFFGNDCHYAHNDPVSGGEYVFSDVEIARMARRRGRRRVHGAFHRAIREAMERSTVGLIHAVPHIGGIDMMEFEAILPIGFSLFEEHLVRHGIERTSDDDDFDDDEDYDDDAWESYDEDEEDDVDEMYLWS